MVQDSRGDIPSVTRGRGRRYAGKHAGLGAQCRHLLATPLAGRPACKKTASYGECKPWTEHSPAALSLCCRRLLHLDFNQAQRQWLCTLRTLRRQLATTASLSLRQKTSAALHCKSSFSVLKHLLVLVSDLTHRAGALGVLESTVLTCQNDKPVAKVTHPGRCCFRLRGSTGTHRSCLTRCLGPPCSRALRLLLSCWLQQPH